MRKKGPLVGSAIMSAIPNLKEGVAVARPRTKKAKDKAAREFGDRLVELRRARGLSQHELSDRTGVYQSDISDFERGERWPDAPVVAKLADTLNVTTDELLGLSKPKSNGGTLYSRRIMRRMHVIETLSKRDQQALFRVIDNALAGATGSRVV